MKKIWFNFLLLIFLFFSYCQESNAQVVGNSQVKLETNHVLNNCEKGTLQAIKDSNKGELGMYFYGLPSPRFNTWVRLMKAEYGIKVKGGGDIVNEEGVCYNQIMREKVIDVFGKDAFLRIDHMLDSLYEIGQGDRLSEFKGGNSALLKFIYCSVNDEMLVVGNEKVPLIIAQFSINEAGKVEECQILFKNQFARNREKLGEVTMDILKKMPLWVPAVENKKTVRSWYRIPIRFQKEIKTRWCE
jgi:hypothetical protein